MAITVFADVILPNNVISAGIRGRQRRKNTRVTAFNGEQAINIDWDKTIREYEIGIAPMSAANWRTIEGLHEVTEGGAYGFLMFDPKDAGVTIDEGLTQSIDSDNVSVGTVGFGYGYPTVQLSKRYTSVGSSRFKDRKITRPYGSPALFRNASPVTLGASPGNATINAATGVATFVADASEAFTSITVGATTTLNFASGAGLVAQLAAGNRVYITGVTGSAATALNNKSHAIASEGATSFVISTSTSGLTATGGTGFKYPQSSEALTWSGLFYVPVHFMNDSIDWDLVVPGAQDMRFVAGPSVVLEEVRE